MTTATLTLEQRTLLRYSAWDGVLVVLALAHAALLVAVPTLPVIAIGLWWNSNTISHNFIHKPFFRARSLNVLLALFLSLLLGVPQALWRDRHLAHHAGVAWRLRFSRRMAAEIAAVLGLWGWLLAWQPRFFLTTYLPGYALGLAICAMHGHFEHARGGTISHYGWLYNLLFFNDGYHVEHHADPGTHWMRLGERPDPGARTSRWPAVLRWLDWFSLESLERLALRAAPLGRFVLASHERAFRRLPLDHEAIRRVGIVGGGLFPRTALILHRLVPHARLVVIDSSAENLAVARSLVRGDVEFVHSAYDPARHNGFDLVVIPLSYVGDIDSIYRHPPAPATAVHDWLWRPRGSTALVSWLLLKRLNLITGMR
jgi:hypothetical protein